MTDAQKERQENENPIHVLLGRREVIVSFLRADVLRPLASVSSIGDEGNIVVIGFEYREQEHGPENANEQKKWRVCHAAEGTAEHACDEDGHVPRTEDEFGFHDAGANRNVEEMRECCKTKREIGARTEGCVAKIEGVGDVTREELGEWESMMKRRSSLLPPEKRACNYIHPKQHSPFPECLRLPYPDEEILSGYEEDVSFIRDGFTTWVKADFNTILERHTVGIGKTLAEFREASARRHDTYSQEYHFDNSLPNRSTVQKRLSIYNWNPGPRRGKEGAIEKQIVEKVAHYHRAGGN